MNCDLLARPYQALEYTAFRKNLEKQRFAFLQQTLDCRRALILGEGDGRFLCRLAGLNSTIAIDCVEASAKMIEVAERRLQKARVAAPSRIRFLQRNALTGIDSTRAYDLIVTHFFLDCFSETDAKTLVNAIRNVCAPAAKWLIAEFQQPETGWRKWHARCWLNTMYFFFALATGLETRRLPDYQSHLSAAGFALQERRLAYADMISSEFWQLGTHLGAEPV